MIMQPNAVIRFPLESSGTSWVVECRENRLTYPQTDMSTRGLGFVLRYQPEMSDEDKKLIMNIQLPITGGLLLMGTDAPESMGFDLAQGNNVYINVIPDSREEADRLFVGH